MADQLRADSAHCFIIIWLNFPTYPPPSGLWLDYPPEIDGRPPTTLIKDFLRLLSANFFIFFFLLFCFVLLLHPSLFTQYIVIRYIRTLRFYINRHFRFLPSPQTEYCIVLGEQFFHCINFVHTRRDQHNRFVDKYRPLTSENRTTIGYRMIDYSRIKARAWLIRGSPRVPFQGVGVVK